MSGKDVNFVGQLPADRLVIETFRIQSVSPDDGKYAQDELTAYLSSEAEWLACAKVQRELLATRVEFGQATTKDLEEVDWALGQISALNMALIEKKVTKHDQLAVLEEIGRFTIERVKALLHPGTTSYDILDTARSYLLKKVWIEKLRPVIVTNIEKLIARAQELNTPDADGNIRALQVGRTHLQHTAPVPFGVTLASYVRRLAGGLEEADRAFGNLKGKVSGIVGTQASVSMVVGQENALDFEEKVLAKLGLEPDYSATQIVQKESLATVGHSLVILMRTLGDFANDMRLLYSSDMGEVTSLDAKARLGGSSADAGKNNPINWENIAGKVAVVESGMRILYEMIQTDLQRDLRGSVQARYQPNQMITEVFESFVRANKELGQLTPIEEKMAENLKRVQDSPTEMMVAILRGESGWVHSVHGVGHDFVKEMAKKAKNEKRKLIEVCLEDAEFTALYETLSLQKQAILQGDLQQYIGTSLERAERNITFARAVISRDVANVLGR